MHFERWKLPGLRIGLALYFTALPSLAMASQSQVSSPSESVLLAEIVGLVFLARFLGEVMLRIGQPAVMGHLLAGVLLGPSVLGVIAPEAQHLLFPPDAAQKAMISGLAQFGILLLLLLAGMETDIALVRKVRRAALTTSFTGIAIPFALGVLLGQSLPASILPDPERRFLTSLFLGTALSISSVKIVASVIRDMGFLRRDVGQIILASAIVDDTLGWIIIAITLSLASRGVLDWWSVGQSVFGTLAFLVISFTFGRQVVFKLIQWSNDYGRGEAPVIATILVIMGVMAFTTHLIGVHTVLGAFIAGILVGESPMLTAQIDEQLRGITAGLFMPIFFGLAGLSADLTVFRDPQMAVLTVLLIAIASVGKTVGAFSGGWLGGLKVRQSLALAAGMNARGSTEVIVASIGFSMGLLSNHLFTMIVTMAIITTLAMPPTLRWALAGLPLDEAERKRLRREEFESRGFLSNVRRMLVVIDATERGRFAARIAGLIAGICKIPVTILKVGKEDSGGERAGASEEDNGVTLDTIAEVISHSSSVATGEAASSQTDVIQRSYELPWEEAVAIEAGKGHDLLIIGFDEVVAPDGGFSQGLSRLAQGFRGTIGIISARGRHEQDGAQGHLRILVPVTGSEVSRRGAELALALGKAAHAPVTAITVVTPQAANDWQRYGTRVQDAYEVGREIKELAEVMDQRVQIARRTSHSSEDAILREARSGDHNLILLGVSRRPGDKLSFGELAAALLESSDRSVMFFAPTSP